MLTLLPVFSCGPPRAAEIDQKKRPTALFYVEVIYILRFSLLRTYSYRKDGKWIKGTSTVLVRMYTLQISLLAK